MREQFCILVVVMVTLYVGSELQGRDFTYVIMLFNK